MADLGHRVFLMAPLRWRGPFARTCREWNEIAAACWHAAHLAPRAPTTSSPSFPPMPPTHVPIRQADDFELVAVQQSVGLARLDSPVTQLSAWVRS